jgi:hypothetical protein
MTIDWQQLEKDLSPIKNYKDLCKRFNRSFSYPFIRKTFDFSIPAMIDYTHRLLGGDSRGRYKEYEARITQGLTKLNQAGCESVFNLTRQTDSREKFELYVERVGIPASEIIQVLKYLVYWFIPGEKYLSGLVRNDPASSEVIKVMAVHSIRTNLQLLQRGISAEGRISLAEITGLPPEVIMGLVNRADFSRMPWASKATISNIIGAGYTSMAQLANAYPEQLYADFFQHGKDIGKNLKFGNEIDNSYRIAKIIPVLVQGET